MELALIIGIFLIGFLLIIVEFFFIPGNTIIGFIGISILGFGIYQVYEFYGAAVGSLALGLFLIFFISSIVYAVRQRAWERFSHEEKLTGNIKSFQYKNTVEEGDTGEAVSAIRPSGKALIKGETYEVQSFGDFINTGTPVKVVKVTANKTFVEPVEEEEDNESPNEEEDESTL